MTTQQPEALQLAFECEESAFHWVNEIDTRAKAAKLLRAQHARIAELEAALVKEAARTASEKRRADQMSQQHDMQAALNRDAREQLAALKAAQQAVRVIKANCYSDDNGDYWRDFPDDCDFVDGLKVGDTYELQASIRSWSETFRVTKAPDETSDDYEVELVSTDAPLAALAAQAKQGGAA